MEFKTVSSALHLPVSKSARLQLSAGPSSSRPKLSWHQGDQFSLRFGGAKLLSDQVIRFNAPVTNESAEALTQAISQLGRIKQKIGGTVKLMINSPGGSVDDGFHVIDTMHNLGVEVDTILMGGMSASMGALLFLAGSKGRRFMSQNARLLIHQPSARGIGGTSNDINDTAKDMSIIRQRIDHFISQRTGVSVADIKTMTDRDTIIYPLKALKMGFTDWVLVGDSDKALNAHSLKGLSDADIEARDAASNYTGLPLATFDPQLPDPAILKKLGLTNQKGGGAAIMTRRAGGPSQADPDEDPEAKQKTAKKLSVIAGATQAGGELPYIARPQIMMLA
ncbi:MAG: ATP-dependent Clp protease proteolytic subunit [Cyanobacteria bacterium]|nr:ATP-dependent Clp protease proteolytic subunit [Cyanobacteriota bacterium]